MAIKDNIAVAGVPMRNGTKILDGYVPEFDATLVSRILDEGEMHVHVPQQFETDYLFPGHAKPF